MLAAKIGSPPAFWNLIAAWMLRAPGIHGSDGRYPADALAPAGRQGDVVGNKGRSRPPDRR